MIFHLYLMWPLNGAKRWYESRARQYVLNNFVKINSDAFFTVNKGVGDRMKSTISLVKHNSNPPRSVFSSRYGNNLALGLCCLHSVRNNLLHIQFFCNDKVVVLRSNSVIMSTSPRSSISNTTARSCFHFCFRLGAVED
jgi:hypothetical protein